MNGTDETKTETLELFDRKYDLFFMDRRKMGSCHPYRISLKAPYSKPASGRYNSVHIKTLDEYQDDMAALIHGWDRTLWNFLANLWFLETRFGVGKYGPDDSDARIYLVAMYNFETKFVGFHRPYAAPESYDRLFPYFEDLYGKALDWPRGGKEVVFPYDFVGISHMALVGEMDERWLMLDHAEEKRMPYGDFVDFTINWVGCHSEKYGEKYRVRADRKPLMVENLSLIEK